MNIDAHYDYEKTPEQNLECVRSLINQGHDVSIQRFPYSKSFGRLIFTHNIKRFSFMGLGSGTPIVDKEGISRVIKHQNTDHIYTCIDGKQVIVGDFEVDNG